MGQTISITPIEVPANTKVYYASAKFRELQIDRLLENRPLVDFPTDRNIFVTSDYDTAIKYSWKVDDPGTYYTTRKNGPPESANNIDVMHVYQTVRDQSLIDISNPNVIHYLLFEDTNSPFHISKQTKSYTDVNIFYHRKAVKGKVALKKFETKLNTSINPFSGFGILSGVTNYHNYYLTKDPMNRVSVIATDYAIANLMRDYAGMNYDGWVQPADDVFHHEFMFFSPSKSLRPLYSDPKEWLQFWIHPDVLKENTFALQKKVKDTLDGLEESFERRSQKSLDKIQKYNDQIENPPEDEVKDYGSVEKFVKAVKGQIKDEEEKLSLAKDRVITNAKTQLIPYLKGAGRLTTSVYSPIQQFYNKSRNHCTFGSSCKTPLSFEQCQKNLENIAYQMELFPNKISNHHVGETVADHSIWVARTIYKWLSYQDHPWVKDIWPEMRNTALLAAFTHDIGKIGDMDTDTLVEVGAKRDHPTRGYLYFVNSLQFKTTNNGIINTTKLIDAIGCNYNKTDVIISAIVAGMHHYLGELLLSLENFYPSNVGGSLGSAVLPFSFDYSRYVLPDTDSKLATILDDGIGAQFKYIIFLHKLLIYLDNADRERIFFEKKNFLQLLHILFAVSAADNYGAYPVGVTREVDSIFKMDASKLLDPEFLFMKTEVCKDANVIEILRPYYRYLYHSTGLIEREKMFEFVISIQNFDIFMEAWNEFDRFLMYIQDPDNKHLPNVYGYLSEQKFEQSLIRLLLKGEISTAPLRTNKISDRVLEMIK